MMGLLIFRERLKNFYGKYDIYVIAVLKFILSFLIFYLLNQNIGSMPLLKNPVVPLVLALVCSFMPYGITAVIASVFMLMHLFSISAEIAVVTAIVLFLVGILYYGQQPGDSVLLLVTPLMFALKIPYVVPLVAGLACGVSAVIPVSCGICIYYVLLYVKQNTGLLTNGAQAEALQKYSQAVSIVINNKQMLVMITAFACSLVIVWVLHRMSFNYSWMAAVIMGMIAQVTVIFLGSMKIHVSLKIGELILGILASLLIVAVYQLFVFAVDYSRVEYVQYEDDEYYYYVKAVPKMMVTEPDVQVHKISSVKGNSRGSREKS
ncbi:MAG: ABC transporter permease [bacterium]|nr:ABC transporter permease [bacterium]